MAFQIIAINPGSTSTKIAVFRDETLLFSRSIDHKAGEMSDEIQQQLDCRAELVLKTLREAGIDVAQTDAFVGRGGGLVSMESGTYRVDETLLAHARAGTGGQHPAQLASQICARLCAQYGGAAFVVNPPDVDEFSDVARMTGLRGVYRESRIHALNQKEVAYRCCAENGLDYYACNLIVAHLGGGISIAAHQRGRMIDCNDILHGDGPMTPTRCGSVSVAQIIRLCFSGEYTEKELLAKTTKTGGLLDLLGTADVREVEARIAAGDAYAALVYDAMCYQIAKQIGSCAAALEGEVARIVLTGGMSHSDYLTGKVKRAVGWIAPITVIAGEYEMEALAAGAYRVLSAQEKPKSYTGQPVWRPELIESKKQGGIP